MKLRNAVLHDAELMRNATFEAHSAPVTLGQHIIDETRNDGPTGLVSGVFCGGNQGVEQSMRAVTRARVSATDVIRSPMGRID